MADEIASEHVRVMTDRDDWFENMTCYRALFLGGTNVANGDKVIGTDTRRKGRALHWWVVGWQVFENTQLSEGDDDEAATMIGGYGSRLCMLEGFVGHTERCNIRCAATARTCPTARLPSDGEHADNRARLDGLRAV